MVSFVCEDKLYCIVLSLHVLIVYSNGCCSDLPYSERVKIALSWLNGSEGEEGANGSGGGGRIPAFMTLYFGAVDKAGHKGGPSSLQVQYTLHLSINSANPCL